MNIVFKCEFCQTEMQASEDAIGKQCFCVSCGMRTTIGKEIPAPPEPEPASVAVRSATDPQLLSIDCPTCTQKLDYAQALIGTKGLCRHCHELFMLPKAGQSAVIVKRRPNYIAFQCPTCLQLFEGSTSQVGLKGRCTNCSSVFTIEALEPKPPTQAPPGPEAVPTTPTRSTTERVAQAKMPVSSATSGAATGRPHTPAKTTYRSLQTSKQPATSASASEPFGLSAPSGDNAFLSSLSAMDFSAPVYSPYQAPMHYGTAASPSSNKSLSAIYSRTLDCFFPAAAFMYIPFGALFLISAIGQIVVLVSQIIHPVAGLAGGIFSFLASLFGAYYLQPAAYKMALNGVRGKEVSLRLVQIDDSIRMSMFGYLIAQYFILMPIVILGAIPLAVVIIPTGSGIITLLGLMTACVTMPIAFSMYVNLTTMGAFAVIDKKGVGEAISTSFRCAFARPGLFLIMMCLEIIPIAILMITIIGIFAVVPYLIIRSAVYYDTFRK